MAWFAVVDSLEHPGKCRSAGRCPLLDRFGHKTDALRELCRRFPAAEGCPPWRAGPCVSEHRLHALGRASQGFRDRFCPGCEHGDLPNLQEWRARQWQLNIRIPRPGRCRTDLVHADIEELYAVI